MGALKGVFKGDRRKFALGLGSLWVLGFEVSGAAGGLVHRGQCFEDQGA